MSSRAAGGCVMGRVLLLLCALLCLPAAAPAAAAAGAKAGEITAELEPFKVVRSAAGVERLEAVEGFEPGDIIEYRAVYTNRGAAAVKGYAGTVPLPPWAVYLPGTARPAAVEASLDGKRFGPVPLTRAVARPDGREGTVEVPAAEYRHLRWNLGDLAPGASATGVFRVRVVEGDEPALRREQKTP